MFLATGLTDHPTDRSGIEEEFMTVEVVDLADVAGLIAAGTVRDATTMVGLLLAERATPERNTHCGRATAQWPAAGAVQATCPAAYAGCPSGTVTASPVALTML